MAGNARGRDIARDLLAAPYVREGHSSHLRHRIENHPFDSFWQTEVGRAKSRNTRAAGGAGRSANQPETPAANHKDKLKAIKSKLMSLLGLFVIGATAAYGTQTDSPKMNGRLKVTTLSPDETRYTGKPYNKELGAYAFNCRNYDPQVSRWTTSDPSGFPDGANNQTYVPVPTYQVDWKGCYTVTLINDFNQGASYAVSSNGSNIGTVNVTTYNSVNSGAQAGADIDLLPNITTSTGQIYRWEQHFSITDQDGNYLQWNGQTAQNLLDPTPNDDDKDWYETNAEWIANATGDGQSTDFNDHPRLNFSRLTGSVSSVEMFFTTQLVQVNNLSQASGGTSLLTISWGFTYSE